MASTKNAVKIYYKPSCITCKRTISEVDRMKMGVEKRDIFEDPLSESEIKKILSLAKISPRDLLRKKDKMYRELGLDGSHTDAQLVKYMAQYPGLIRRPILFGRNRIIIGKASSSEIKSV